jgi:hypothetical protein
LEGSRKVKRTMHDRCEFRYNNSKKGFLMRTIKLEIEDSKLDIVLNIIQNLKDDVVKKYEVINEDRDQKDFIEISQGALKQIWDNQEDSVYDRYL